MTRTRTGMMLCIFTSLGLLGCSRNEKAGSVADKVTGANKPAALSPANPSPASPAESTPSPKPDDVLVEVNGTRLTRKDAEQEAGQRLKIARSQMRPEQFAELQPRILSYVIDQFVVRTLLLQEAGRRGIVVGDKDVDRELQNIARQLPPGMTVSQIMQTSSVGEEQMRQEVVTKIKVDTLMSWNSATGAVSDADVEAFYKEHGDRLMVPENVHARHILISVAEKDDEATREAKRKKAEDVRKQVIDGADFAETAREYSDCPSKKMGGDLGRFKRGQMVKPFEDAAFSAEAGKIGPVVETKFGYHIIEVLEHNKEARLPREKVVEMLKAERQRSKLATLIRELKEKADIRYAPDAPRMQQTPSVTPQAGVMGPEAVK